MVLDRLPESWSNLAKIVASVACCILVIGRRLWSKFAPFRPRLVPKIDRTRSSRFSTLDRFNLGTHDQEQDHDKTGVFHVLCSPPTRED
jgi:hypothetical protein